MRLYLARHGEAGQAASDAERSLTLRGISETRAVFRSVASRISEPLTSLISSPLLRARQTADIALELLPCATDSVSISDKLLPSSSPQKIVDLVFGFQFPVMLVFHQPVMGELLGWLTGDEYLRYGVATSSLYALDLFAPGQGCAELHWQSTA